MTKLSGQDLTDAIEHELQAMVRDGYEVSPISNKALYLRLISKHVISGSISTLTSRKDIIGHYKISLERTHESTPFIIINWLWE